MSLGTNHCAMPRGIIGKLHLRLECVMESVGCEILQFCQVFGTHCHVEHFKCGELTTALCQSLPIVNVFD